MVTPSPLAKALAAAVIQVRTTLGDPVAPVVVLTPSAANGVLARQQLAQAADFIRVDFATPERLLRDLAGGALALRGLRPEPAGWLQATIGAWVAGHGPALGRYGEVLGQPGWSRALAMAVETLEASGVDAAGLGRVSLPEHAERLSALSQVLGAVEARRGVDRLYALSELCRAAGATLAASRWAGAVVLGDRLLAPKVHEVLAEWLATRPHVEVRPHPWHRLAPAPRGLRAATRGAVLDVPSEVGGRLGAVTAGVGPVPLPLGPAGPVLSPPGPAGPVPLPLGPAGPVPLPPGPAGPVPLPLGPAGPVLSPPGPAALGADPSLVLARTPDDVREVSEAVREVLDAIRDGVALDRIAVVLPDVAQVEVLRANLVQAGVPATWLVGGALAETPAGGFLLQALAVATGEDHVPGWYELLRQPGLRLKAAVAADVVQGQGRWRRILSQCGASVLADRIVTAVSEWSQERDPEDQRAAANLRRAIEALDAALASLRTPGTQGEHAHRWTALLRKWWVPSPDRDQILALLRGWGSPGVGVSLSLHAAQDLLQSALKATAVLFGTLSEPAIRVTSPMGLLGGAFERVVVTGLVEGRFPRRPVEDPILPDQLVDQLNAALGTSLHRSLDLHAFEERRFAAVVSSCTGRLWLSSPATEFLEERPLLPSGFVLEVASVLLGHRARYQDLRPLQVVCGSRARPWVEDPERAIGALEHRIAAAALDRHRGLAQLARHSGGRRLLGLHRALHTDQPGPWTGVLDPSLLSVPGMTGEPVSAWTLSSLLRNPGQFLVDELLGVRSPAALSRKSEPTDARFQQDQVRRALTDALEAGGDLRTAFLVAWDVRIQAWRKHRADVDDATVRLVRSLAQLLLDGLVAGDAIPSGRLVSEVGPVDATLPWTVKTLETWLDGACLTELRNRKKPTRGKLGRDATALVLSALAHPGVSDLRVCSVSDGAAVTGDLAGERPAFLEQLRAATRAVGLGWYPWSGTYGGAVRFAAEGVHDMATLDRWFPEGQ